MTTHSKSNPVAAQGKLLGLLTKDQLAEELGIPLHGVQALTRHKKISVIRLGHKTLRYRLEQVREDLQQLEVKAIPAGYREEISAPSARPEPGPRYSSKRSRSRFVGAVTPSF